MTTDKNGNGTKNSTIWYLIGLIIAMFSWFLITGWARSDNMSKEMQCLLPRTEWAARNVFVDGQIIRLREEQAVQFRELRQDRMADMNQINQKLDKITDHLLRKKE